MAADLRQFDVVVLGGGAAGLMCAAVAGQRGRRVALLEHNGQVGRKILISGGGRCNFTNLHCGPGNFISENRHFAKSALAGYGPRHFLEMVDRYGIRWHEKTLGQLFCDGSARQIVEMLLAECARGGVEVVVEAKGIEVERGTGRFGVRCSAGEFESESLVVATGGLSIPKIGATGLGYELARQFGLKLVATRPGLAPLVLGGADKGWTELAGVSAEVVAWAEPTVSSGAKAHGYIEGQQYELKPAPFPKSVRFREKMLATHRGMSGPAILQASSYWRPGEKLVVDLTPGLERGLGVLAGLRGPGAKRDAAAVRQALGRVFPQRLAGFLTEMATPVGLKEGMPWGNAGLEGLERRLRGWELTPVGTEGYEKAEVTAGGVDTDEIQARTMEARAVSGLFFVGEVVDVTGWLGGFNFQWGWASGVAAGKQC
jgi:predicted Rossmann fold flavoprotein